jgi:hypothetical protein
VRHGAFTYLVAGALRGWADGELDGARDGAVTAEEAAQFVQQGLRRVGRLDQRPSAEVVDARAFVLSRGTEPAPSFDAPVAVVAAAPPPAAPAPAAPTPATPLASTATEAAILGLFNELGPPGGASAPAAQPTFSDDAMAAFARGLGVPASAPPAPQAAVTAAPAARPSGEPVTVGGITLWPYAQADGRVEWVLDTLEPVSDGRGLQAALHRVAHTHDAPAYSLYERNTMAWIDLPRGYPEPDEPALEEVEPAARPIHHDTVIPGVGWDLVLLGRTPAREIAGAYRDRCVMRSVSASRARPCRAGGAPEYGVIEGAGEYGPTAMPSLTVQEGVVTAMYVNTRHCNSRTPEGIRPCDGSTTRELIAAYGPPTRVEPFGGQDEWVYGPIGLIARVRGDRVEELVITLPEGEGHAP